MLVSLIGMEQRKVFQRRILWVELAILLALLAFVLCARFLMTPSAATGVTLPKVDAPQALAMVLQLSVNPQIGGLLIIILTGAVVAQEYAWRTLHLVLSRGAPRPTLVVAKFAALLPALAIFVLVPLVVGVALSALLLLATQSAIDLSTIKFDRLAYAVLFGAYGLLPYAGLAFMLAVLSRSTVTAIGGGIGVALLETAMFQVLSSLGGTLAQVARWLPSSFATATTSIVQSVSATGVGANAAVVTQTVSPELAAAGIAAYTLVFVAVAGIAFVRQDLTG